MSTLSEYMLPLPLWLPPTTDLCMEHRHTMGLRQSLLMCHILGETGSGQPSFDRIWGILKWARSPTSLGDSAVWVTEPRKDVRPLYLQMHLLLLRGSWAKSSRFFSVLPPSPPVSRNGPSPLHVQNRGPCLRNNTAHFSKGSMGICKRIMRLFFLLSFSD